VALGLLAYCSFSYSDPATVYGQTPNAAATGLAWGMQTLLPQQAGLTVSGVIYQYTTIKNTEDDMLVHVQNEDLQGPGYIFRETDDWSGRPGNTINKLVPIPLVPLQRWGPGSIEVEGQGSVTDPLVIYNYQYDPCFDPQSDPSCPGYKTEVLLEVLDPLQYVKDPLDDELIQEELDKKAEKDDDEEEEEDREAMFEKMAKLSELEQVLGGVNAVLIDIQAQQKHTELMAMNYIPPQYYNALDGKTYQDTIGYPANQLPDSGASKRVGLAQELLHQEMVDSQFKK